MTSLLDLVMLICASIGALAFGILAAFGVLRICFTLMRPQTDETAVKPAPEAARIS